MYSRDRTCHKFNIIAILFLLTQHQYPFLTPRKGDDAVHVFDKIFKVSLTCLDLELILFKRSAV
jgi:hypothetical protein